MLTEPIKLSPKKNGNGYVSSYSVSISNKEAKDCGLVGKRLIKIIDSNNAEIVIKAKRFTLTIEMLKQLAYLKEKEDIENKQIFEQYSSDGKVLSGPDAVREFFDVHSGKVKTPAYDKLQEYLMTLSIENITDLVLMMYLGRDMDCNMNEEPGEKRFLDFYDRYYDIVSGKCEMELIDIFLEKAPSLMYLRTAYRLINAPKGTPIDNFSHDWGEM